MGTRKMAVTLVVLVLCAVAMAAPLKEEDMRPVVDMDLIASINDGSTSWTAGVNDYFQGMSVVEAKRLMGARPTPLSERPPVRDITVTTIPDNFDPFKAFPGCIGAIRDQGRCGSCWAFGGVEAISDRLCIHKNKKYITLAPLDVVECDRNLFDNGCNGGQVASPWTYARRDGIVTESCMPYNESIPTCPPAQEPCLNFVKTPACHRECKNGASYEGDKHKISQTYSVSSDADKIAQEIMENGPVEAAFSVYSDFVHYKSGVYEHKSGQMLGGHAIKIIGFGTTASGEKYWQVANSWTTSWGNKGFF